MKKKCVITGGTGDLGQCIIDLLIENNYEIVFNFKEDDISAQILCEKYDGLIKGFKSFNGFSKYIYSVFKEVDILINNCGISKIKLLQDMSDIEIEELFSANIIEPIKLTRELIPLLKKSKNNPLIINISSIWGKKGGSMESVYSATKGSLESFSRSLGCELGPLNIRSISIAPGVIDTDMNKSLDIPYILEEIPLKRMGSPREIGELVLFLCEKGTYVNCETITIDGGFTL